MFDGERKRGDLVKKLEDIKRQNVELKAALAEHQAESTGRFSLLQAMIDAIPIPVFYKDVAGIYRGCNRSYSVMMGIDKDEIAGKTVDEIAPPNQTSKYHLIDQELLANPGTQIYNHQVRFADGLDHSVILHTATYEDASGNLAGLVGMMIDTTEQILAEQNLRQMASEVQAILQALPDVFFRLDAEGTILDLKTDQTFDLYFPAESLLGKKIQQVHHALGRQFRQAIHQVLETNSMSLLEYSIPDKSGEELYEARFVPVFDNQIIVIARNITARKKAEVELALRAELLNAANDSITLHDFEGKLVFVNEATCKLYGYSADELLLKNVSDLYSAESARNQETRVDALKEKGHAMFEVIHLRKDGSLLPLEVNARLIEVGSRILTLSVARDIAERQRANEDLQKERDFTSAVLDIVGAQVVVLDRQGRVVRFNRACELATGYSFKEVRGRCIWDILTDEPAQVMSRVKQELAGNHPCAHESFWITRTRERRLISWSTTALHDGQGNVEHLISTGVDVTERRQAERDLKEANSKLATRVDDLKERTQEMLLLGEMGELLQNCEDFEETYAVSARYIQKLFPFEHGALCLTSPSRDMVEAVEMWGDPPPTERVFTPSDCWALRRGRPHLVEDPQPGLMCAHVIGPQPPQYLCVPMMARSEALGILHIRHFRTAIEQNESAWTCADEHKQRLAMAVADQIAMALANLRLRETLRNMAIRDTLTGLFNRRYMEESLERELKRAERRKTTVGVIMFDIDHFKDFNDIYGHDGGDALLRELGSFLQSRTRGEDIACRYGGEEFVYVLPEASLEDTLCRAEQLRIDVKQITVYHLGRRLDNISISLGITTFPEHGLAVETILKAADTALYQAKNEGRDRAIVG